MPRDLDLTFDISTGALTLDRVVGNYVKRSETLTLSVTIVSNGASATIPSGLVGTLKPVNTYGTTLAQWTTFSQVGATNVYTASTTINAAAVTTLLGTTTEQSNCVFDFAGAGVVESDTLALVLKNNVTRDDDTAPTALLNRNDFLVTNGTGLLVNVAAGYAANGAFVAAQASLAITNATNYIEVTAAGVASVNTTAFTAGSYPLATVVASAGAITANTDLRAWITPKPATGGGGGVTSITGTANEITVTGTTTPTLSLPSALTFTAKTITGGTFASPSLTTPTIGDGTESAPSLSFTTDANTGVYRPAADTVGIVGGGNDVVRMTGIASATDYLEIKNGIGVGSPLHVLAEGASANIGVHLQPKGSGLFTISDGTDFAKGIRFRSSSSAASAVTLIDAVSTAGRVVTLPDATGTLALVSGNLGTPSALVGTNITGTASGLTAGNATLAATVTVANEATDTTCFPLFATAATGSLAAMSNAGLTFDSATGLLSATGVTITYLNVTAGSGGATQIDSTGNLTSYSNTGTGQKWLQLYSNDDSVKLYNSAGGYYDPPTITFTSSNGSASLTSASFLGEISVVNLGTIIGNDIKLGGGSFKTGSWPNYDAAIINNDGSARFANGDCTIGTDGSIIFGAGSAGYLNGDGSASFANGTLTIGSDGTTISSVGIKAANGLVSIGNTDGTAAWIDDDGSASFASGACTINGSGYAGAGSGLTSLNADNISSGTLAADRGGTGVSNNAAATLTRSGNHALTITTAGTTGVTLPTTGTLATLAGTETLTNKRLTQRTGTDTSSATPTINTDNVDFYSLTAQAADITSFTTNLSGTPTEGQQLWIAITGTAARAITWGATFEAGAVALPTTTVTTTRLDVAFIWNPVTSKWRCMASG